MEYLWHVIWNIYEATILQDVVAWNIFTFAIFFLKCMHLHTKGRGEVKFRIILHLYQVDDPQKLAMLIVFCHLAMIVSEISLILGFYWNFWLFPGKLEMQLKYCPKIMCYYVICNIMSFPITRIIFVNRVIAALFIKLFRISNLCLCRKTWAWWGVFLFMILWMFHFFRAIFVTTFNVIFKYHLFCPDIFKQSCTQN